MYTKYSVFQNVCWEFHAYKDIVSHSLLLAGQEGKYPALIRQAIALVKFITLMKV